MNRITPKVKTIYILALAIITIITFTIPAQAVTYTYDSLNRLTSVTYKPGQTISYSYDAGGNMLAVNALGFDDTPPATTAKLQGEAGVEDWYRSDVQVVLTAVDEEGGSGVAKIEYSLDGTEWLEYKAPFTITNEGTSTFFFKSTDNAGNVEAKKEQSVKIDKTVPTISSVVYSQPNATGWYNTDVTVAFTASDALSGIDTVTPETVISTEGANQSLTGITKDKAGNIAESVVSGINIDKTAPETAATPDRAANTNGWYNNDVTLTLSATDKLGGSGLTKTEYSFNCKH